MSTVTYSFFQLL